MTHSLPTSRSLRAAVLATSLTLLATACSTDPTPVAEPTATGAPTASDGPTSEPAGDWTVAAAAACGPYRDAVNEASSPIFESEEEPDPEAVRAMFATVTPDLVALRDEVAALEVAADAAADRDALVATWDAQIASFEAAAESPEAAMEQLDSLNGPFSAEAGAAADAAGVFDCGTGTTFEESEFTEAEAAAATTQAVIGTDFAFEAPAELAAGDYVFEFENAGGVEHEMILAALAEGTTYEDALAWLEENAESQEEPEFLIGFWGGFAGPNGRTDINARLEPGTYAMICFLDEPDGEPHFLKGMAQEVTVTA